MTRDKQGEIHLLHNRCPHRGNRVCMTEQGNARSFTCPYHGWTFANDGDLKGYPFPSGYEGVDRSELGRAAGARGQLPRLHLRLHGRRRTHARGAPGAGDALARPGNRRGAEARRTASSSSSKAMTAAAGPNVSSAITGMSTVTSTQHRGRVPSTCSRSSGWPPTRARPPRPVPRRRPAGAGRRRGRRGRADRSSSHHPPGSPTRQPGDGDGEPPTELLGDRLVDDEPFRAPGSSARR